MTLSEVITKTANYLRVDLDSEVDTADNAAMTTAVNEAAKQWTRDTLCLWSWQSTITLSAGVSEYNLTDSAICADLVFLCRGVFVAGTWLELAKPQHLMPGGVLDGYAGLANSDNPGYWTKKAPSSIRIIAPPSATAAAASNYVIGWREHPAYTYGSNSGTEMLGPSADHRFIAMKAAINLAMAYAGSDHGWKRYAELVREYEAHAQELRRLMEAEYADRVAQAGAGHRRMLFEL